MKENGTPLTDAYKRRLNYLRISITDRCNLRCIYCMPAGGVPKLRHGDILTYEEILRLSRIAADLGIEKIRVTGGEPLVRKGVLDFLRSMAGIPGIRDLALTTNGVLLGENLEKLKAAGLKRLNISLDSLRPERFREITGHDAFHQVWEAVQGARRLGFSPIRINMVVIRGRNDDEILDFAELSLKHPYHIRYIEYMPFGGSEEGHAIHHVPSSEIKKMVAGLGRLQPVSRDPFDGPADRYRFEGAPGEIGFISPISHHFCAVCNRLRLTASGRLRPCLLSDRELDVVGPLRNGASDRELSEIFIKAAMNKPYAHSPARDSSTAFSGQMWSIGG
ncbi:MAG: GTP 3',8-cyclase MoaA [Deltaproteobacteria bacterium]|nr:GTP 3',8-cyclase MoaA [Deltaproteobacteria bacterium]